DIRTVALRPSAFTSSAAAARMHVATTVRSAITFKVPELERAFGCAENQSKPVPFLWSGSARHSSGDLRVRSFNDRQRAIISTYKGFELEVRLRLRLRDLGVRTDLGEDGNAPSKWRIHQPVVLTL